MKFLGGIFIGTSSDRGWSLSGSRNILSRMPCTFLTFTRFCCQFLQMNELRDCCLVFIIVVIILLNYSLLCSWADGMLIMRARPPPAHDFISVFQKFKLAITLLVSEFSSLRSWGLQTELIVSLLGWIIVQHEIF